MNYVRRSCRPRKQTDRLDSSTRNKKVKKEKKRKEEKETPDVEQRHHHHRPQRPAASSCSATTTSSKVKCGDSQTKRLTSKLNNYKKQQEKLEYVLHLVHLQLEDYLRRRLSVTTQKVKTLSEELAQQDEETTKIPRVSNRSKVSRYIRKRKNRVIRRKMRSTIARKEVVEEVKPSTDDEETLVIDEDTSNDELISNISFPTTATASQFPSQNLPVGMDTPILHVSESLLAKVTLPFKDETSDPAVPVVELSYSESGFNIEPVNLFCFSPPVPSSPPPPCQSPSFFPCAYDMFDRASECFD